METSHYTCFSLNHIAIKNPLQSLHDKSIKIYKPIAGKPTHADNSSN